jgi:hypothetical protein
VVTNTNRDYKNHGNIDASTENATRTSSHDTRRETVIGYTPPAHVNDDCKYAKLKYIYIIQQSYLIIKKRNKKKENNWLTRLRYHKQNSSLTEYLYISASSGVTLV